MIGMLRIVMSKSRFLHWTAAAAACGRFATALRPLRPPIPVEPIPVERIPVEPMPVEPIPAEPIPVEPNPVPKSSQTTQMQSKLALQTAFPGCKVNVLVVKWVCWL